MPSVVERLIMNFYLGVEWGERNRRSTGSCVEIQIPFMEIRTNVLTYLFIGLVNKNNITYIKIFMMVFYNLRTKELQETEFKSQTQTI